ncbi:MAG: TSUP family transporter [Gammaproteobacteria bacterium]|nr:TSUP family transporter [Gammaproteobacteria bacterium]
MDVLSPELLLILFTVATVAGFVDAIAGGGGLLTLPVLLWSGMTPVEALATNKLQGSFGTFSASLHFIRGKWVSLQDLIPEIALTFIGSVSGTLLVQHLDTGVLVDVIPVLLIGMALYTLFSPRMEDIESRQRISRRLFVLLIGFGVGFYDGFFGPGTGSLFCIAFVALMGLGLNRATAHAKILNFTSNIAALIFFAAGGHMVWTVGLVMAAGQILGAYVGAHTVMTQGSRVIKPLLFLVSLALALKLLLSNSN